MTTKFKTWLGEVPELPVDFIPLDTPEFEEMVKFWRDRKVSETTTDSHQKFSLIFNTDPVSTCQLLMSKDVRLGNPFFLGPYLCLSNPYTLDPRQVHAAVFANPKTAKTTLYHFYSAVNLGFVSFYQTAYYLCPRVAFCTSRSNISCIFNTLADAYHTANQFCSLTRLETAKLFASFVMFSLYKTKESEMSLQDYLTHIKDIPLAKDIKKGIYKEMQKNPIPIFVTFALFESDPKLTCHGYLRKPGGTFGKGRKKFYEIEGCQLNTYPDQHKKARVAEIDLIDCKAVYLKAKHHDPHRVALSKYDGQSFGYKIKKEKREKSSRIEYTFVSEAGDDESARMEIMRWTDCLNYMCFISALKSIMEM